MDDHDNKPEYLFDVHSPGAANLNLNNITNATVSGLSPWQKRVVELLTKATVATTVALYAVAEIYKEITSPNNNDQGYRDGG